MHQYVAIISSCTSLCYQKNCVGRSFAVNFQTNYFPFDDGMKIAKVKICRRVTLSKFSDFVF